MIDTDFFLGDYFQKEYESDEFFNKDIAKDNHYLNAFELLSSLHEKKEHEKLGQHYIDMPNDWTKNYDKVSNTFEIENFLKVYKNVDIKKDDTSKNLNIKLSNEQSEVLDIFRYQLNR